MRSYNTEIISEDTLRRAMNDGMSYAIREGNTLHFFTSKDAMLNAKDHMRVYDAGGKEITNTELGHAGYLSENTFDLFLYQP